MNFPDFAGGLPESAPTLVMFSPTCARDGRESQIVAGPEVHVFCTKKTSQNILFENICRNSQRSITAHPPPKFESFVSQLGFRWHLRDHRVGRDLYTESGQTLQVSFSAVSKPIASKY